MSDTAQDFKQGGTRRRIKNGILILFLAAVAYGAIGMSLYAPPDPPVAGATTLERAQSIAENVSARYPAVTVPPIGVSQDALAQGDGSYVRFYAEWDRTADVIPALTDILRLSREHLFSNDFSVKEIRIRLDGPDEAIYEFTCAADRLNSVDAESAADDAWIQACQFRELNLAGVLQEMERGEERNAFFAWLAERYPDQLNQYYNQFKQEQEGS
jgi:hypothetical protein